MAEINKKLTGGILIGLSVILIFVLVFVKINHDKEGAFLCKVVAADPKLSMDDCPAHDSSSSWLIMVAFGVAIAILISGGILVFKSKESGELTAPAPKHVARIDTKNLGEEERRIIDLLQQHQGSMYQSDIARMTGYTKVQTTRLLDKLEGKSILERRRRGMANIVILK
jgi:uncharacterized membrane protein